MKIDVIDMGDPNTTAYDQARVENFSDKIFHLDGKMCNAVHDLVDKIVNFVSASGKINFLRFWSHGNPTTQQLFTDHDVKSKPADNNAFWTTTIFDNAYYLQNLTPLFAADGIIELHGCNIAAGTTGEMFLCKFAYAVNVPVVGQDKTQGGDGSTLDVGTNIAWESGLVTMAFPDYSITYGPGSTL